MADISKIMQLLTLSLSSCFAFNICEYRCQLFKQEPIPTEEAAYQALKTCPDTIDATYVAVPWVVLQNQFRNSWNRAKRQVKKQIPLADELHHKLPWVDAQNSKLHEQLGIQKVKNGFVVCQHIHFRTLVPYLKQLGVRTIFTPHAKEETYMGMRVEPFPIFPKNGVDPAKDKDIWFSFIGRITHKCRHQVMKLARTSNTVIQLPATGKQANQRFKDVLARSRFSLCPRGTGPGSIRFWESLQAGAIPVLIADGLRLPSNFDWSRCVIRVAQRDIHKIPDIVAQITPEKEAEMRKACLDAHNTFSGTNIISPILHFYE